MLCPVGPVGAGKTTVLKPLSRQLGLVRVEADAIRRRLKAAGYGYDRAKAMTFRLVEQYVRRGYGVAVDTNCGSAESQRAIRQLVRRSGCKLIWLHVKPPERFIIHKLKHHPPSTDPLY